MAYRNLRKVFHMSESDYDAEYLKRYEDPHTIHVGFDVDGSPAFMVMAPELYELIIESLKLDKEIAVIQGKLPGEAIARHKDSLLIDEIVLTNDIEGVNSTRREIGEVLKDLQETDRNRRFHGIVQKYRLLQDDAIIPLSSCEDIRSVYDDLVLDEVTADDESKKPDGKLFRAGPVHVVDQAGIPIHDGTEPESKITSNLEKSLMLLHNDSIPLLARIGAFHFLFGYIHPFYDGNGRTNRFISSLMLTQGYVSIAAFGLSSAIKQEIRKYYRAYSTCEHTLNKGDITPFVIAFSEIVINALQDLRDSLAEKEKHYRQIQERLLPALPESSRPVAQEITTATLFSPYGATASEMADSLHISRQTLYKRLEPLKEEKLVQSRKVGRQVYYYYTIIDF